jgi:hypothetical protein
MTLYLTVLISLFCVVLPRVKPEGRLAYLCKEFERGSG